jgi:hypothetical protein
VDQVAVRLESLGVIAGIISLAIWALVDAARRPAADANGDHPRPLLVEISRPGEKPELVTLLDGMLVGRSTQCGIVLADATVSKEHARLTIEGSRALVEDLHSTNGTLVNGVVIVGPTALSPGDRIGLGANVIWFLGESRSE